MRAAIFTPWGPNHRVLADHWTRLSVSNYIMIIFSSQQEQGVSVRNFGLFLQRSSTRSRAEVEGRFMAPEVVSLRLDGLDA